MISHGLIEKFSQEEIQIIFDVAFNSINDNALRVSIADKLDVNEKILIDLSSYYDFVSVDFP